jgi:hypothetical protein
LAIAGAAMTMPQSAATKVRDLFMGARRSLADGWNANHPEAGAQYTTPARAHTPQPGVGESKNAAPFTSRSKAL